MHYIFCSPVIEPLVVLSPAELFMPEVRVRLLLAFGHLEGPDHRPQSHFACILAEYALHPVFIRRSDNGCSAWTTERVYPIERIVSATKVSGGWQLSVKVWVPEPLWKILEQTSNPTILQEIERCKADYLSRHPRMLTEEINETIPSRSQPSRKRDQPERFTFAVFGLWSL